jgi:hypothetical protein
MREILFRGKRVDNGEWDEGYLSEDTICSAVNTYVAFVICKKPKGVYDDEWYEIDPDTIGQYTGLTDKNGKMIFEGDIVHQYNEGLDNEYLYDLRADVGRVFWHQEATRFLRTSKLFPDNCPEICAHCEYEVVGNIYDNPELLEALKCD